MEHKTQLRASIFCHSRNPAETGCKKNCGINRVSYVISFCWKENNMGHFQIFIITRFFHLSFLFYPKNPANICEQTLPRTQIREV